MKNWYLLLAVLDVVVATLPPYDFGNVVMLGMAYLMYTFYSQEK